MAIALATSVAVVSGGPLIYPALPIIGDDLRVEAASIGLVMTAFATPAIFLALIFGVVADLKGLKPYLWRTVRALREPRLLSPGRFQFGRHDSLGLGRREQPDRGTTIMRIAI